MTAEQPISDIELAHELDEFPHRCAFAESIVDFEGEAAIATQWFHGFEAALHRARDDALDRAAGEHRHQTGGLATALRRKGPFTGSGRGFLGLRMPHQVEQSVIPRSLGAE
jgi:hypothetical protein